MLSLSPLMAPCITLLFCLRLIAQSPADSGPANDNAELRSADFLSLENAFHSEQLPLYTKYCLDCHSTAERAGELDLEQFSQLLQVRQQTGVWQGVAEMLANREMPPHDALQPSDSERSMMSKWVHQYLNAEALASAGDPGPVVLRRLNNAEYTYTIQDLAGISIFPAREFPVDGAAGEGFTNTGNALNMSPSLVTKYMDAAREIASHAVLLPDGFTFSNAQTRRDWTDEKLNQIREFYQRYSTASQGGEVNLQGVKFATNGDGRLPLSAYLEALLTHRDKLLASDSNSALFAQIARTSQNRLSAKYLGILWNSLFAPKSAAEDSRSLILNQLESQLTAATLDNLPEVIQTIEQWQQSLWTFESVGHIGKVDGPQRWLETVSPLAVEQNFRTDLTTVAEAAQAAGQDSITLHLHVSNAGDGNEGDVALWESPRLESKSRPDVLLRDVAAISHTMRAHRTQAIASTANYLNAAAIVRQSPTTTDIAQVAADLSLNLPTLRAWLGYLDIVAAEPAVLGAPITGRMENAAEFDFIQGWVGADALSVVANSSDQHVRIPGNMLPHSIAVHPSPTQTVGIGWRSPLSGTISVEGSIVHAHPECGNGVEWALEIRRGTTKRLLSSGVSQGSTAVRFTSPGNVQVHAGDALCLLVSPRDGNHSCDLTTVDLTLSTTEQRWNLSDDLSSNLLAGNPHADMQGHDNVWSFFSQPTAAMLATAPVVPAESILHQWQLSNDSTQQKSLAQQLQKLLLAPPIHGDSPDAKLYQQLTAWDGPIVTSLFESALQEFAARSATSNPSNHSDKTTFGINPLSFGILPVVVEGETAKVRGLPPIASDSLCIRAPSSIAIRIPLELAMGTELVTTGTLEPHTGADGSLQFQITTSIANDHQSLPQAEQLAAPVAISSSGQGVWTANNHAVDFETPVITTADSPTRRRFEVAFSEFRDLFPAALCYVKMVPVDEVVTLNLLYREDEHLQRLMLDPQEIAELNRLWSELHYISRDALTSVDAFEQLMEFATQDADPSVFAPLRASIEQRAAEFQETLLESEPQHVKQLLSFASAAFRHPLQPSEEERLRTFYQHLRDLGFSHEDAFTKTLQRILVSPSFLYRLEQPAPGPTAGPVSDLELATRLSYFLWSSLPDGELLELAVAGRLHESDVLVQQAQRMLRDERIGRLSTEFMCQWLQIYEFDQLDEKSERHFPTFAEARPLLYLEAMHCFTDLFQRDRSLRQLYSSNSTFLNASLAQHYGIPNIQGDDFRRYDNLQEYGRGGLLGLGAILAKQSGASRTSPILRGTWLSEVLLGEKLPKPPPGIPPLPDDAVSEQLTSRQLVEKHTSNESCARCHRRIDPYGFALESFDAIGRLRTTEENGQELDTTATLPDGTPVQGAQDLKNYLTGARWDTVTKQFCRKLLGYALGRSVQLSDQPVLAEMQHQLETNDYRISSAITTIVTSPQFRNIRGREHHSGERETYIEDR
ncbi:hypothetical protein Q31a_26120 [Aureliella helgolandensis]|uniref:Planctomycete cytochrome C n=2 Tax=Aureliella helgolandensis TaxID=2527968 RepID=A0A518G6U1_9BACT|nr:hypothetical protein Q31a_26120 [Aureliella helgolandensis]